MHCWIFWCSAFLIISVLFATISMSLKSFVMDRSKKFGAFGFSLCFIWVDMAYWNLIFWSIFLAIQSFSFFCCYIQLYFGIDPNLLPLRSLFLSHRFVQRLILCLCFFFLVFHVFWFISVLLFVLFQLLFHPQGGYQFCSFFHFLTIFMLINLIHLSLLVVHLFIYFFYIWSLIKKYFL